MKRFYFFLTAMLALVCAVKSHDKISENALAELSAQKSLWEGADRYDFKYKGRDAILVAPQNPRSDRAWIMRPAFFGAFANADAELVRRGFFSCLLRPYSLLRQPASNAHGRRLLRFCKKFV